MFYRGEQGLSKGSLPYRTLWKMDYFFYGSVGEIKKAKPKILVWIGRNVIPSFLSEDGNHKHSVAHLK